ncbi:hypothetical protein ACJX0J_009404, partial [Zea mays]
CCHIASIATECCFFPRWDAALLPIVRKDNITLVEAIVHMYRICGHNQLICVALFLEQTHEDTDGAVTRHQTCLIDVLYLFLEPLYFNHSLLYGHAAAEGNH